MGEPGEREEMTVPGERAVAIVGMAALFPGAPDLATYWANITGGVDSIREAPPERLDPIFCDPSSNEPDRFSCRRGGFLGEDTRFDAIGFGIMPVTVAGTEPDQLLMLQTAARAIDDMRSRPEFLQSANTGVIVGRGGYMTAGLARFNMRVHTTTQVVEALRSLVPSLSEEQLAGVKQELLAQLGPWSPEAAVGLVPNLVASRIANRLDLHGPSYVVDAACASSLVAVDHACRELEAHTCDAVIAGGVHLCQDAPFLAGFHQLGAVSGSQQIRPFDRKADGLLVGEGLGALVLKRLEDARRHGDRVYAVIRGSGCASDGRGASLMVPRVEGQLAALERAWRGTGLDPKTVGLIEAHGTATPTGDETELTTLAQFFGPAEQSESRAGLGSVKSMIGHLMPAAGMAGLIKTALAVYHGLLPPTLHCDEPHELVEKTRFRLVREAEPWESTGRTRRAGINAFGFGGINAHLVLEQASAPKGPRARKPGSSPSAASAAPELLLLAAGSPAELAQALAQEPPPRRTLTGPCRLAVVDPTPERLERARKIVDRGKPWRGRQGIFFVPSGLLSDGGRLAFLYPGVEPSFNPRFADVAEHFGLAVSDVLAQSETAAESRGRDDDATVDLERQGAGIIELGRLLTKVLGKLGVEPDMLAGHSIGEWNAMITAGVVPETEVDSFVDSLVPGTLDVPGVVFVAAGCGSEKAEAALAGLDEIAISHDNCPHQTVLCGRDTSMATALERLRANKVICQVLPFQSGFHSPLFTDYLQPYRENLLNFSLVPAHTELWSATTCEQYPREATAIRTLVLDHLLQSIRFRDLIERLYDQGARVFLQVGAGSLTGFVDDTLRGKPHLAIAANTPKQTGLAQLQRVAAALFVEGAEPRLDQLPGIDAPAEPPKGMPIDLAVPLVRFERPLVLAPTVPSAHGASIPVPAGIQPPADEHQVLDEFRATLNEAVAAGDAVVNAWREAETQSPPHPRPAGAVERSPSPGGQHVVPPTANRLGGQPGDAPSGAQPSTMPSPDGVWRWKQVMRIEDHPDLLDHTFYRQPDNWPNVADRYPVVPMTALIEMMIERAHAVIPGRIATAIVDVRALRWTAVAPEVELEIEARHKGRDADGCDRVQVRFRGNAEGTVILGDAYPPPRAPDERPLLNEQTDELAVDRLYEDRYMFHGPAYQGVVSVDSLADNGLRGVLVTKPALGALLDNAGQLMGYWIMRSTEIDRLAFPIHIRRISFYRPHPTPGEQLPCRVLVESKDDVQVIADLEVGRGDSLWAFAEGWRDRRFNTDADTWRLRFPEKNILSHERDESYCIVPEHWKTTASRELMVRRYLNAAELEEWDKITPPRKRGWLLGRIAVKDAVRAWLWRHGAGPIFPVELTVHNDPSGQPRVTGPFAHDLRVSLAHKETIAVARVAQGVDTGIDLEQIERRPESFTRVAFTARERELLAKLEGDRDLLLTLAWAAKEAVAKARGTGLEGNPRQFAIEEIRDRRLRVDGTWVDTRIEEQYVVAWTELSR